MFYRLKKGLMCRALEKRNKEKPFDYSYAENFTLDGETDALLNNSYYFSAHSGEMSFFARLGKRVHEDETWFALYLEGKLYSLKQELFRSGGSPLIVEKDGEKWTLSFQGLLNEDDQVSFGATFTPKQAPIDFTSNMPPERMAGAIANEKWSREFFNGLQNVSGQCHYEQEGVLEGQLTLNGKTMDFSLPCVRDHSFGKRDWNYMNNHLWLMAVSSSGQFNYSMVSYPVITALEVGNYRNESGMHYMMQADLDFRQVGKGSIPQELSFTVLLDNQQAIKVQAEVLTGITYHFKNGQYILHENIAEFRIDGQTCRGILEIGFNSESKRFFNGRDLNGIKR
jgi:hypothetical protein